MHTPTQPILYPLLAMVLLTLLVWIWMYVTRTLPVLRGELKMDDFKGHDAPYPAPLRLATDNFSNLFEMPVLFYLLCVLLYISPGVSQGMLLMAWAYVALRALHSLIHCLWNHVLSRLVSYQLSSLLLWVMWARYAIDYVFYASVQV